MSVRRFSGGSDISALATPERVRVQYEPFTHREAAELLIEAELLVKLSWQGDFSHHADCFVFSFAYPQSA